MNTPIRILSVLALTLGLGPANAQTFINAGNFISTGSNQILNGTTTGITVNDPGGNWVWGNGWNWAGPQVNATWLGGTIQNAAVLGEENTVVSLTLASTGGYTKPTSFSVTADIALDGSLANSTAGLGFWSTQPTQADATSSLTNFTGFTFDEAGSLKLYSAGVQQGSAVALGPLSEFVFYNLSYTVDTTSGDVSGVVFNGNAISDFATTAFSNSATGFVGVMSANASRAGFDNLLVTAIPEPATAVFLLGGVASLFVVRRRQA